MKTNLSAVKIDLKKASARIVHIMTVVMVLIAVLSWCGVEYVRMREFETFDRIDILCKKYYLDYLFSYLFLAFGYYLICGVVLRNDNKKALLWGSIVGAIGIINKLTLFIPLLDMIVAAITITIVAWNKYSRKRVLFIDILFAFSLIIGAVLLSISSKWVEWFAVQNSFILSAVLSFDIFLWYGMIYLIIFTVSSNNKDRKPLIKHLINYLYVKMRIERLPSIKLKISDMKEFIHFVVAMLYNIFVMIVIFFIANMYDLVGATIIATFCYLVNKNFYGKALKLRLNLLTFAICMTTYYVIVTTLNPIGKGTNLSVLVGSIIGIITSYAASGKMYQYEPIVLLPKDMLKEKYKDKTIEELTKMAVARGMKPCVGETIYYYIRMTAEQVAEKLQVQPRTVYRRVADFNKKEDTKK